MRVKCRDIPKRSHWAVTRNARDRAAMAEQETMESDDDFEPTRKRFKKSEQLTVRDLDSCQWPESPHLPNECSGEHGVSILMFCNSCQNKWKALAPVLGLYSSVRWKVVATVATELIT